MATLNPPSRLVLGSAQFGLSYGVANRTGQPSYETVREIIREAHAGGVDVIDTAPYYGDAEERIGRALRELGIAGTMRIETKINTLPSGLAPKEAARQIEASLTASLQRLGMERVSICLFHREDNLVYADELLALQAKGLIGIAGVSIAHPEFARRALERPELRMWQIPSNLLDRRYTHSGLTAEAAKAGTTILVRSSFLQGLLLLDDDATPPFLRPVIPARRRLREIAARFGLTMEALAVRWLLSRPDIRSVVVGIETTAQIRENLRLFAQGPLPAEVFAVLDTFEPGLPDFVASPPEWEMAKAAFAGSS